MFSELLGVVTLMSIEVYFLWLYYERLKQFEPRNYYTLSNLLLQRMNWWLVLRYFIFRALPIWLIVLFNIKLVPYLFNVLGSWTFCFNFTMTLLHLWFTNIKSLKSSSRNILSIVTHSVVILVLLAIPFISQVYFTKFDKFLPTGQWIIDNVWSSLIAFFLVSFFYSSSSSYYQIDTEFMVSKIRKFEVRLKESAEKHKANLDLVRAVAIFECLQRPLWIRFFESLLARIISRPISQGLMQVKHSGYLSDDQSIELAVGNFLKNTENITNYDELGKVILNYNNSQDYQNDVIEVYASIRHSEATPESYARGESASEDYSI